MTGPRAQWITTRLQAEFAPDHLEVLDESAQHAGHNAEARDHGETHFRVRMTSKALTGLSRVAQHRAVNAALAEALANGVHALALELKGA